MGGILQTLKSLGPTRLMALSGVGLLLIVFFAFLILRVSAPNMDLLYRDLSPADAGQIVDRLDSQQIDYQLLKGGTEILVPADQVNRLRIAMAEAGLPSGGSVGYEIFDKQDGMGSTSFEQNINHVRALEGELSRTIASIQSVKQARVHLVLPKRQMFSRETQEPSASIALQLQGKELDAEQVAAIQHLVAAAVPQLVPSKVSIIDERGHLLARGDGEQQTATFLTQTADEMRIRNETRLRNTIEDLLSRSLGYDQVRAEVSVDMNFNKVTTNNERFNPDEQVVRSSQTVDQTSTNTETDGTDPVTLQNNLPDPNLSSNGAGSNSQENRSEETVNYEISKTTTTSIKEIGEISRVTVAVLVDGTYSTNENGEQVYQERSPQDLDKIAALVRSAIGYDPNRGDQVEVINMKFADTSDMFSDAPVDTFLGLDKNEVFRIAEMLVLAIVAILVILLVVRPLLTRAFETLPSAADMAQRQLLAEDGSMLAEGGQPALAGPAPVPGAHMADEHDELINISQVEGRVKASSVKKIGEIVDKHPEEALAIIRNWLYQEN
ncbi:flagellar basal-body MS-ring/collar protein FliF [Thalassospira marina]|uniref:Flagellar M-ring protein n=1 Tax=Thalassospira marina TaxID=2048283 RepID=A0A2N3KZC0_9PROT|nr:flagellar basal-body MS-ring/collar protein FliF [Thalassospira marina]AUG51986.1 flagellar M-ring protein FliF [Thalassospira marina]PKR55915.1 flagellar M-ring protein FliF [Thalassospira marina]